MRAAQRFGLRLNRHQLRELVQRVQRGDGRCVARQSLRVSEWEMLVQGQLVRVIYDKTRKNIVTFLPND